MHMNAANILETNYIIPDNHIQPDEINVELQSEVLNIVASSLILGVHPIPSKLVIVLCLDMWKYLVKIGSRVLDSYIEF